MNYNESILNRIKETEDILKNSKNDNIIYLSVLNSLRDDYFNVNDIENNIRICEEIIEIITSDIIKYDNKEQNKVYDILLSAYDDKARSGDLDSFIIAMEWNRPIKNKFYIPRRRIFIRHKLIQSLQELVNREIDILILNLPPGVGKSTLGLFTIALMAGLKPEEFIVGTGHTTGLTNGFYKEIINFMTSNEYRFKEIFKLDIVDKNAEYTFIDLKNKKRFHTITFRSLDASTSGLVRASNLLYCDDMVQSPQEANNPETLEKIFYNYTGTFKDRKEGECVELHIGTPWSLSDPMARLEELYQDSTDIKCKVVSIPCYNENGESNFMYDFGKEIATKKFKDMETVEDPVIFSAKYLMQRVERDGRPFNKDNLQFYYDLPDKEPDRIVMYVDSAFGGEDYLAAPIGYVYDNEVYIKDAVYTQADTDVSRPLMCTAIIENNVEKCGFEENNGGKLLSELVETDLKAQGYRCNITSHRVPTNKAKLDRIMACQSEIKGIATQLNTYKVYFLHHSKRENNIQYNNFMKCLYNFSQKISVQGKQQDGSPDALAGMITNILIGSSGKISSPISRKELGV